MRAAADIRCENGVWADLRITNDGSQPALIHNPGDHRPTEKWEFSRQAYQIAVLRSFHFLDMILRAPDGSVVEPAEVRSRADHLVGLPLELAPGGELVIQIPLHEFYALESGRAYALALTYGDDHARVSAAAQVHCP